MTRRRVGRAWMWVLGVLLLWVPARAQEKGAERVGGTVVSARDGHPLAHAMVTLANTESGRVAEQVFTDGMGHFQFGVLPPGKYRLTGAAAHFLPASYMSHEQYATAIVTGAGLATGALELRLTPQARISGQVLEDAEPVARAQVTLYRENAATVAVTRMRTASTDDEGRYEFERMGAGRYFVGVTATPWYAMHPPPVTQGAAESVGTAVDPALDVAYPMTFYPEAHDSAEAEPLVLMGGEDVRADIRLHPEPALTLTLPAAPPGNQSFPRITRTVFGSEEPVPTMEDFVGNTPRMTGLARGQYNVTMVGRAGIDMGSQSVDLRSGPAVLAALAMTAPGSVTVTVHVPNGGKLPANVGLRNGSSSNGISRVNEKGVAVIAGVPPGEYRVVAMGNGRQFTVLSVSAEGKPVAGGRLHVGPGGTVAAEATVTASATEVEGVTMRDGKPDAGAMVVLVPASGDSSTDLYRRDQSDLDGSFVFHNVAPGNYIAVAIDNGWPLRWNDAAALGPYLLHGVAVPVAAGATGTVKLTELLQAQAR